MLRNSDFGLNTDYWSVDSDRGYDVFREQDQYAHLSFPPTTSLVFPEKQKSGASKKFSRRSTKTKTKIKDKGINPATRLQDI